jgi:hypothetical protein
VKADGEEPKETFQAKHLEVMIPVTYEAHRHFPGKLSDREANFTYAARVFLSGDLETRFGLRILKVNSGKARIAFVEPVMKCARVNHASQSRLRESLHLDSNNRAGYFPSTCARK